MSKVQLTRSELVIAPAAQSTAPALSSRERLGVGLALVALYIIWGSTYLGMRIAIESFPPFLMAGIRFICAGLLLYAFLRLRGHAAPTGKQWGGATIIGVLMLVCSNGMVSFAEQWVATGIVAIALAAVPLYSALIFGLLGRWPSRFEWLGLGLGFVGVIMLNLEHGLWTNPQGALALLIAPFCWSLGSALSSRFPMASGLMASATQMLGGGVALLLLGVGLGEHISGWPSTRSWLAMLYLVLIGSLVGYTAYGYLLRRVRPALATSYAYVNPIVAVGLGALMAGEQIAPVGIIAMLIILTGVALVSLRKRR